MKDGPIEPAREPRSERDAWSGRRFGMLRTPMPTLSHLPPLADNEGLAA